MSRSGRPIEHKGRGNRSRAALRDSVRGGPRKVAPSVLLSIFLMPFFFLMPVLGGAADLKVGDRAPDFALPDQNGKVVKLSDFRGKKSVVLAFYIRASTPG